MCQAGTTPPIGSRRTGRYSLLVIKMSQLGCLEVVAYSRPARTPSRFGGFKRSKPSGAGSVKASTSWACWNGRTWSDAPLKKILPSAVSHQAGLCVCSSRLAPTVPKETPSVRLVRSFRVFGAGCKPAEVAADYSSSMPTLSMRESTSSRGAACVPDCMTFAEPVAMERRMVSSSDWPSSPA